MALYKRCYSDPLKKKTQKTNVNLHCSSKAKTGALSEAGARARLLVEGINKVCSNQFGISGLWRLGLCWKSYEGNLCFFISAVPVLFRCSSAPKMFCELPNVSFKPHRPAGTVPDSCILKGTTFENKHKRSSFMMSNLHTEALKLIPH